MLPVPHLPCPRSEPHKMLLCSGLHRMRSPDRYILCDLACQLNIVARLLVPSQSMLVKRLSCAKLVCFFCPFNSIDPNVDPAAIFVNIPSGAIFRFLASIATTHWLPNLSAASEISSGRLIAEELIEILSAPSRSNTLKIFYRTNPTPDCKWDKHFFCHSADHIYHGISSI